MKGDLLNINKFGSSVEWISGIVVDRADPQSRGRVRVRWWGYYSDEIPVQDLPWSIVVQDVNSAALAGIGKAPVGLMNGSVVLGSWLDGRSQQNAVVFGSLGPIDGILSSSGLGDNLDATYNASGVLDSGVIGPNTPSNAKFVGTGPAWFQAAKGELGVKETPGHGSNPDVMKYAKTNGFSEDNTPWCSSFVRWCVEQGGQSADGTNGLARSWLNASAWERIQDPLHGCIVSYSRGAAPKGHVGFVDSIQGGRIMTLGGNQGNMVKVSGYSSGKVLGYMWPRGFAKEPYKIS